MVVIRFGLTDSQPLVECWIGKLVGATNFAGILTWGDFDVGIRTKGKRS